MISTAAAILGAAVIGGGASALASNSAAKTAANAANNATTANNALSRDIYNQNQATLSPYIQGGYGANQALLARLGITGAPMPTRQAPNVLNATQGANGTWSVPQGAQPAYDYAAYVEQNPDIKAEAEKIIASNPGSIGDLNGDGRIDTTDYGINHARVFHDRAVPTVAQAPVDPNAPTPLTPEQQLQSDVGNAPTYTRPDPGSEPGLPDVGFNAYQESDYTKFLKDQGQRNLNARAAAGGLLNSGAAVQGALQLGQDISGKGYQDWFGNQLGLYDRRVGQWNLDRNVLNDNFNQDRGFGYGQYVDNRNYKTNRYDTLTNNLLNLSGQGLQAGGALAGVGTQYAGQVSANNNAAASATGNAALAGAANTTGMVNNALGAFGYYLGSKAPGGFAGTFPAQSSPLNPYGSYQGAVNPYRT